ncbi:MAG: DUF423 domain-containing protein [Alcanivorax sp.]|nr:DUF423 domain-containing protein [Alcanivorax sp.]
MKMLLILGALNAALAVVCGAFGAHGLKARVEAGLLEAGRLDTWATASEYHFFQALGLLLVGLLAKQFSAAVGIVTAGWILFAGMLVFSGSLYLLVLTGQRWLGAVTPFGGTLLIIGWVWLAFSLYKTV